LISLSPRIEGRKLELARRVNIDVVVY